MRPFPFSSAAQLFPFSANLPKAIYFPTISSPCYFIAFVFLSNFLLFCFLFFFFFGAFGEKEEEIGNRKGERNYVLFTTLGYT